MGKKHGAYAIAVTAPEDEPVDVFSLPPWLKGSSRNDSKALREAKMRRAAFPDVATKRFAKRNEDKIYGFAQDNRTQTAIKNLLKYCSSEIVSRTPLSLDNLRDCRVKSLLLKIDPNNDSWMNDPLAILQKDIFDRIILPSDEHGHYIPLGDGRIYLPLSRYARSDLATLCNAIEDLTSVVEKEFTKRPVWHNLAAISKQMDDFKKKPIFYVNQPLKLSAAALKEVRSINFNEPPDFYTTLQLLPKKLIEFKLASKEATALVRQEYGSELREKFLAAACEEIFTRYSRILPREKLQKVLKNCNNHHITPVSFGGTNVFNDPSSPDPNTEDNNNLVLIDEKFHHYIHEYINGTMRRIQNIQNEHKDIAPTLLKNKLKAISGVVVGDDDKAYITIPSFAGRKVCIPQLVQFEHRHGIGFLNSPGEPQPALN